jgi:hypothetical protein
MKYSEAKEHIWRTCTVYIIVYRVQIICCSGPGGELVCQTAAEVVKCSTLDGSYPGITTVADLADCKTVCLAAYGKDPVTCQAFTFLSERVSTYAVGCLRLWRVTFMLFYLKSIENVYLPRLSLTLYWGHHHLFIRVYNTYIMLHHVNACERTYIYRYIQTLLFYKVAQNTTTPRNTSTKVFLYQQCAVCNLWLLNFILVNTVKVYSNIKKYSLEEWEASVYIHTCLHACLLLNYLFSFALPIRHHG